MNRAGQRAAGAPRTGFLRSRAKRRGPSFNVNAAIAGWAEGNPEITRVWLFSRHSDRPARDGELDIALELQPVGDSEETITAWMAHGDRWRAELQARVGRPVELDWLDADGASRSARAKSGEVRSLVYQRSG